jgi:hypothetical protein
LGCTLRGGDLREMIPEIRTAVALWASGALIQDRQLRAVPDVDAMSGEGSD